ncbi:glutathione transferase zeta 1 [Neoconidiobolus thromboides FSU 785]|nr:glutathione transferase zeta 1 [Neoconidiobolus thromboides FSU 785]
MKPVLYSYFRSSCSARVRIALILKGIEYDYVPIHLVEGKQKSQEYLDINLQGKLPCLKIGDKVISQSLAILEYLEEVYPENPLLPKDPFERSKVRSLALSIVADIQPIQNLSVLKKIGDGNKEWANYFITEGFKILEQELKSVHGKYGYGDAITLLDLCIYPQVYNALRFEVDMNEFPIINQIYKNLEQVEAFQKGDWKAQPDTPKELLK